MTGSPSRITAPQTGHTKLSVLIAFLVLLVLCLAITFEVGARLILVYKENVKHMARLLFNQAPVIALDDYEELDFSGTNHFVLRPNFRQTLTAAIQSKRSAGKFLAAEYYERRATELGIAGNEIIFRINSHGFRGPDIDALHSRIRILSLGDSCTFGTFEWYSYPRTLERELQKKGLDVEVINAGVEGYKAENLSLRAGEFQALQPEVTIIYIGWNDLYQEEFWHGLAKYLYSIRLLAHIQGKLLGVSTQQEAVALYTKRKEPDPIAPELDVLESFYPAAFIGRVTSVVQRLRSRGSEVVILTLPGLYSLDEVPSDKALAMGHLPPFTRNPYVLAKLTERYNSALRGLASTLNVELVDLDSWSHQALRPRDMYFFDSVHLREEGQEKVGRFLAVEIEGLIRRLKKPIVYGR